VRYNMRTKNTCRYYCAVDKEQDELKSYYGCTSFFKQRRMAIIYGDGRFGKDGYIIIHWDFELPKKEGKE